MRTSSSTAAISLRTFLVLLALFCITQKGIAQDKGNYSLSLQQESESKDQTQPNQSEESQKLMSRAELKDLMDQNTLVYQISEIKNKIINLEMGKADSQTALTTSSNATKPKTVTELLKQKRKLERELEKLRKKNPPDVERK